MSLQFLSSTLDTAGGSGTDVALYDLRMTGRSNSQAVQRYRPRPLRRKSAVSVSGIELSKDKHELLVAYESDQCYTFPVLPETSVAGQTISDINASSYHSTTMGATPVSELAQYGGHLNRLTFLKVRLTSCCLCYVSPGFYDLFCLDSSTRWQSMRVLMMNTSAQALIVAMHGFMKNAAVLLQVCRKETYLCLFRSN